MRPLHFLLFLVLFSQPASSSAGSICNRLFDRWELGTPFNEQIVKGEVDKYRKLLWGTHDNSGSDDLGPRDTLKGFDSRLDMKRQGSAARNGNNLVPAYYKSFEVGGQNTFESISKIFYRHKNELTEEWWEAYRNIEMLIHEHDRYERKINQEISIGFEALKRFEIIREEIRRNKLRIKTFQDPKIRKTGYKISLPILRYDPQTKTTSEEWKEETYYEWNALIGDRDDARDQYERVFGKPANPAILIKDELRKSGLNLSDIAKPWSWFGIALGAPKGAWHWLKGTARWVKAYFTKSGHLEQFIESQAFARRRLILTYRAILKREQTFRYGLIPEEKELLEKLEKSLSNPSLAPRSDAVFTALKTEMKHEQASLLGKRQGDVTNKAQRLERYDDQINSEFEKTEKTGVLQKIKKMILNYKKTSSASALVVVLGSGWAVKNWDRIQMTVMQKYPNVAAMYHYAINKSNMAFIDFFDAKGNLSLLAKDSLREWTMMEITPDQIVKSYLEWVKHEHRADPSVDFLNDAEYVRRRTLIIDHIIEIQKDRADKAMRADVQDAIQERFKHHTATSMRDAFIAEYPKQKDHITYAFNLFEANNYNFTEEVLTLLAIEAPLTVYADLKYFMELRFNDAFKHFKRYGVLYDRNGNAYENFGNAETGIIQEGWNIRLNSKGDRGAILWTTERENPVLVLGEENGMIEVLPIKPNGIKSPTGEYFVSPESLKE